MNMFVIIHLVVIHVCVHVAMVSGADLRVGAFNIQVFGRTKAKKTDVMDVLVKIISRYDLLLIQEIRDSSGTAIVDLLTAVNRAATEDKKFSMEISGRLGRSRSKEQYAYFYRKGAGLKLIQSYTFNDASINDKFEREPFIAVFRSSNTVLYEFALAGIHVDPDKAVEEISSLQAVFDDPLLATAHVTNVMVLGDLNADCSYVRKSEWKYIHLKNDADYTWMIGDDDDTTVKDTDCAYDRFIYRGDDWSRGIVPESARVFRFSNQTDGMGIMDKKLAVAVSDHFPIEFLLKESKSVTQTVVVLDVYVVLINIHDSLVDNTEYHLTDRMLVKDDAGKIFGRLSDKRYGKNLITKIEVIIKHGLNYGDILVTRGRRRYGTFQKANLFIKVAVENKHLVDGYLETSCRYFKCFNQ